VLGIGMGGEWASGAVLVSETWPAEHRGKAIGIMQSGWALGYMLAAALAALRRALAPDGEVVISIPNVAHLWMRLSLLAGRFDYGERGILDRTHLRFFTRRTLAALVTGAGLRVARLTSTPVPLYQVVPPRWHGRALAAVHALSARSALALPRLLAYQFVVGARRA